MLILRKEAEEDVRDAYEWYEGQRENLGHVFIAEVERALGMVAEYPEAHAKVFRSVRRSLCKRFPYAIYFVQLVAPISVSVIGGMEVAGWGVSMHRTILTVTVIQERWDERYISL